jgi:predicted nucleic acid-binding protein
MSAPDFLDTNVLVYVYDDGAPAKQAVARKLLQRGMNGDCVISVQVLSEFAAVLLHKFSTPVAHEQMIEILDAMSPLRVVEPDKGTVRRAVEAFAEYGVHFYDGMILAAAEQAGCSKVWSEDLNSGQEYFGMKVENPFE